MLQKSPRCEAIAKALAKLNRTKHEKLPTSIGKWEEIVRDLALGHMIANAPPESYGEEYKRWSLDTLPIVPGNGKCLILRASLTIFRI